MWKHNRMHSYNQFAHSRKNVSFVETRLLGETDFSPNFVDLYQPVFVKKMRSTLRAKTILREFVNTEYEGTLSKHGDEVTVFTAPEVKGTQKKKSATNFYNKIPRTSGKPTKENLKVDEVYEFNVALSIVDQRISEIDGLANTYAQEVMRDIEEVTEADIASNFVYTDNNNLLIDESTGILTVNDAAHTAGSTVTVDSDTNAAVGDIMFGTDQNGDTFAALVKSKGSNVITIETDSALFPVGVDTRLHFAKLVTQLPALADNAKLYLDHPITVDKNSFYDVLIDMQTRVMERKAAVGDHFVFSPIRPTRLLNKDNSTILNNDFLGKEVIVFGQVRKIDGGVLIGSPHGTARVHPTKGTLYYVLMARNKWSLHYIDWLQSAAVDRIEETGGTLFTHSGYHIYQSHSFRQGRKGMALAVVKI